MGLDGEHSEYQVHIYSRIGCIGAYYTSRMRRGRWRNGQFNRSVRFDTRNQLNINATGRSAKHPHCFGGGSRSFHSDKELDHEL